MPAFESSEMQYDDFSPTTSGTLQVFYDGINIDSTTEPSVRFNSITTGQNNISSAAPTWNAVRVKPLNATTD